METTTSTSFTCKECGCSRWLSFNHGKHVLCVVIYAALFLSLFKLFIESNTEHLHDLWEEYGVLWTLGLYAMRCTAFLILPFQVLNTFGVVLFSTFPPKPRLMRPPLLAPFLCFRVVTRGTFPRLVKETVARNLEVCQNVDLQNFVMEVVTDHPINLPKTSRIRELVVPTAYRTAKGSQFKARALQYCLEPQVNNLSDEDWIIHLDEETMLTEDSVVGILNFVAEGRHQFGQGVITYSHGHIVNWITTIADNVRVGVDYGCLRFCLKALHKPVFNWKGSFIVARAGVERSISFDHGPEGSIAEDAFYAMLAYQRGYSFGFVEGEMHEKSTFTIGDYLRQRKRWMIGLYLAAKTKQAAFRYKLGSVLMSLGSGLLPLAIVNVILGIVSPLPNPWYLALIYAYSTSTMLYLFILGSIKSFAVSRYGMARCLLLALSSVPIAFFCALLEITASVNAFWLRSKNEFYIVQKESMSSSCLTAAARDYILPSHHVSFGTLNRLANGLGCANGLANGFVNGHANGFINGRANGLASGHTNGHAHGLVNGYCNGFVKEHSALNGSVNGRRMASNGYSSELVADEAVSCRNASVAQGYNSLVSDFIRSDCLQIV